MTRGLEHIPNLPDGWAMHHYGDEVTWWDDSRPYPVDYWVCRYPFVPGFFVAVLLEDEEREIASSHPIAGPFKSLHAAIAAATLIRP